MPLAPLYDGISPAELLARLDLLVDVAKDASDLIDALIGTGYSATQPEFQLSIYLDSMHRQANNLRARAQQIYRAAP